MPRMFFPSVEGVTSCRVRVRLGENKRRTCRNYPLSIPFSLYLAMERNHETILIGLGPNAFLLGEIIEGLCVD